MSMSLQEINVAIAKRLGWVWHEATSESGDVDFWTSPNGTDVTWSNFYADLNACHEMEKVLTDSQCDTYGLQLTTIMSELGRSPNARDYYDWNASSEVRCEAFLKTFGDWKE